MMTFWHLIQIARAIPKTCLGALIKSRLLSIAVGVLVASLAFGGTIGSVQAELFDVFAGDTAGFPVSSERTPTKTVSMVLTAYTSDPAETDSTPTITASGSTVRHGVVASNYFPIGTHVRIPELYGNHVFVVEDRMNARYHKRMDIWMEEKSAAKSFGIQQVQIEVY